jgi:hypothetical protein
MTRAMIIIKSRKQNRATTHPSVDKRERSADDSFLALVLLASAGIVREESTNWDS